MCSVLSLIRPGALAARFFSPSRPCSLCLLVLCSLFLGTSALPALAGIEEPFLYHPRKYPARLEKRMPKSVVTLDFQTSSGQQFAYYVAPQNRRLRVPERLWVCFGGNASLALDWREMAEESYPDKSAGYLMIEYPGYGKCSGTPSASSILENTERAVVALADHLEVPRERLEENMNLIGYSLGTATALQFAVRHPVKRVVLIAPFTSIRAMAMKYVGFMGSFLVDQQYDNEACLRKLAARPEPPQVAIVHGDKDGVIPVEMGRSLAKKHPKMIDYFEIGGGDHFTIFSLGAATIFEAMEPKRRSQNRD